MLCYRKLFFFSFFLPLWMAFSSVSSGKSIAKTVSLCNTQEKVVFNCPARGKNGKYVSLCVSKDLSKSSGYMKYRFGKPSQIELEYPSNNSNTLSQFKVNTYYRGGGVQNAGMWLYSIVFENDNNRYAVFSDFVSEGNKTLRGVEVNEKRLFCEAPIVDRLRDFKPDFEELLERE